MENSYHFLTRWRVRASLREVSDILEDGSRLSEWWPAVYLKVDRVGETYHLHTRGLLPYTLRWSFVVTGSNPPHGFALAATGDLEGTGEWTLTQVGDEVDVVFDWRVRAEKPILRYGSWLFKPLFAANHRWAMDSGLVSLERELRRRRGESAPPPPGPVSDAWLGLPLLVFLWWLWRRR